MFGFKLRHYYLKSSYSWIIKFKQLNQNKQIFHVYIFCLQILKSELLKEQLFYNNFAYKLLYTKICVSLLNTALDKIKTRDTNLAFLWEKQFS